MSREHNSISDEWSLAECMRILLRRKATLLSIVFMGFLVTLLVTSGQPRVYQSRALLEFQAFNENFLNLRDIYPTAASSGDTVSYVQTETELLQQDLLIEQVARQFHLERLAEFQPPSTFLSKLRQVIRIVPLRNSRIIQVVCDARDPALAANLANTLAQTFIEQSTETRQRAARQTYESLRLQLEELRHQEAGAARPDGNAARRPYLRKIDASRIDADRQMYEAMLQKANDARMASGVRQSNIRLIGPAEPGARPYKPNLPLNLILGTLGGLVLAIGCVLLQEQNTLVLHSPGEAERCLVRPELGAIPNDGAWKRPALGFLHYGNGKLCIEKAVLEQRSSYVSESYRATLASILSAPHGEYTRTLAFTSSQPMEGKTTVVSNLGLALAEIGRSVLLIDGDMRQPKLHRIFDQANGWGLSDVLREWDTLEELPLKVLVKKTAVANLYLLPGGTSTDNILGLLHSGRMHKLLLRCREEFDYVLVDSPPCLEFGDAKSMARHTDGLVLVVRARYTGRKTAQAAVQRLECDGRRVTGVILNGWDSSRSDPYGRLTFRGLSPQGIA